MYDSIIYLKKDCPQKKKTGSKWFETSNMHVDAKVTEAYKIGAYSHKNKQIFMGEIVNAAVLDSACSKTIAGH